MEILATLLRHPRQSHLAALAQLNSCLIAFVLKGAELIALVDILYVLV